MDAILKPKSVAVVGASRTPGHLGRDIFDNLVNSGFHGDLYPVNPKLRDIDGRKAYADVGLIPGSLDLALIVVPRAQVLSVLKQCGEKGVRGVVLITSGFGEIGAVEEQEKIRAMAERFSMRVVGPNCMGVMNMDPAVNLNAGFSPFFPAFGNVALASQSGSLGQAIMDYSASLGIGLSSFVSLGNRVDISEIDCLNYWKTDPKTKVILLYMESFDGGEAFYEKAREVAAQKPVILLQGGRSKVGERAVAAHTGSTAGKDAIVGAHLQKSGVLRVNTLDALFGLTSVISSQPEPRGKRVGIMTNAGGPAILAADHCERLGLEVSALSEMTLTKLREYLPPEASLKNPIDMISSASPDDFSRTLKLLHDDPAVDMVLLNFIHPVGRDPQVFLRAIVETAKKLKQTKPIVLSFLVGSGRRGLLEILREKHLPIFSFPEQAAQALALTTTLRELRSAL